MGHENNAPKYLSINDLKCGNFLNYYSEGEEFHFEVDWSCLQWISEDPKGFNLVHSPIRLTEEWLLKFGFSNENYKAEYIGKIFKNGGIILDFVLSKPFSKGEWNNTYTFDLGEYRHRKIEYVHELQNLYYCITGDILLI